MINVEGVDLVHTIQDNHDPIQGNLNLFYEKMTNEKKKKLMILS